MMAAGLQMAIAIQCGLFVAVGWDWHGWGFVALKALAVGLGLELAGPLLRRFFAALEVHDDD